MKRPCVPVVFALLVMSVLSHAQDYNESDNDDETSPQTAELYLRFDKQGGANVDLTIGEKPQDWDKIRDGLATSLHCPAHHFRSPAIDSYVVKGIDQWPPTKREEYLRS